MFGLHLHTSKFVLAHFSIQIVIFLTLKCKNNLHTLIQSQSTIVLKIGSVIDSVMLLGN